MIIHFWGQFHLNILISNKTSDIQNQITAKQNIGNYSTIGYKNSISSKLSFNYINQNTLTNNFHNYVLSNVFTPNMTYQYI